MNYKRLQKTIFLINGKKYQIQNKLGEGSHATVWEAHHIFYPYNSLTIKVAKDKKQVAFERVQNEIWFLKEVSYPNIPKLLDYGTYKNYIWLAIPTLKELSITMPIYTKPELIKISDISPEGYPKFAARVPFVLRERVAIQILRDIGKVISYLSGTGIVHADITPLNIMENRGSIVDKTYYLTDWGATAMIHRYPEQTFGSLHFTAPERLLGNIGIKSDLFSLGVTAFYILTGTIPYPGTTGELYYLSVSKNDTIAPSDLEKDVNPNLDKLIKDLIRFKEVDRPQPEDLCKRIDKIMMQMK